MAFEHYIRSGTKQLRCGYTTGTCAALAAAAATQILFTGRPPETVSLVTGSGIPVEVAVDHWGLDGTSAWAGIPKDAGDDADVTDGLLICARVSPCDVPGIHIDGGIGVGRVTKPGLDQPVGNAAINSGPRRMITQAVGAACGELGITLREDVSVGEAAALTGKRKGDPAEAPEDIRTAADPVSPAEGPAAPAGLAVEIFVPEGQAAAKKTFNPKLGIEGGISILGTTGIVEPMSQQALIDSIEVEMRQIAAESEDLIITPGNFGADYIAGHDLDALGIPVLKISNFLGESLDMIAGLPIRRVLLVAHVGKLSKVAAGIMNTHSRYADGRNEVFCAHAAICGGSTKLARQLMAAATTDACIALLDREQPAETAVEDQVTATATSPSAGPDHGPCTDPSVDPTASAVQPAFRHRVLTSICTAVQEKLDRRTAGNCEIGALMFSNEYGFLGMTDPARELLDRWEAGARKKT